MSEGKEMLKFLPFKSIVDPSFWHRLTEIKLEIDKLNENSHKIWGYYSHKKPEGQNQLFSVDATSFNESPDENRIFGVGSIINKNTFEGFKEADKLELLQTFGKLFMTVIKEKAVDEPALLSVFFIFSFANLKSYQYYYWFAYPAPTFLSCNLLENSKSLREVLNNKQRDILCSYYKELNCFNRGFFIVKKECEGLKGFTLKEGLNVMEGEGWFLVFADSSESKYPSWPLRNFIAFVIYHRPELKKCLQIICLRMDFFNGNWCTDHSIVLSVEININSDGWEKAEAGENWVGWEKNEKGKMGPRLANLKHFMDPNYLAESSVDLNIKLMKWQILPDLNLDVVKNSKCLLIGAGTLGCAVARNLMSWGVRHISFIDYGTVSYSNPVRQCLYKFSDTGRSKAETAAAALKEIFPGMISSGHSFTIPMPGHPVGDSLLEETRSNVKKLEELIDEHDAIFLLMDSRESRWLPTLIGAAKSKLVINAALGFDSYLVMRHGLKSNCESGKESSNEKVLGGGKLGCYFCNDVTAPGNSFRGRTLDQQCTVTRPGVSNMAAAYAVELFVSILQHPLQGLAPAETNPESQDTESLLGIVPHSIRGFISHYHTVLPAVECFLSCVACSQTVVSKYLEEGFDFILKALESKEYLENLCGLIALQNEALISEADVLEYSGSESED